METLEKENSNIQIDSDLEKESQELFSSLGLNVTTAINIFLKKSLEVGGMPFDVKRSSPNAQTILAIEEARHDINNRTSQEGFSAKEALEYLDNDD